MAAGEDLGPEGGRGDELTLAVSDRSTLRLECEGDDNAGADGV